MTQESSSKSVRRRGINPIVIELGGRENTQSVAFLVDGKHVVSGGYSGKIRYWRVEDGKEVGMAMDAGTLVCNMAVSRDGKWIVSGTRDGLVAVWNAESHKKVIEFTGHSEYARVVDVSPDGTRIASGSDDKTVCVWSLSTGRRLLGPLTHAYWVAAAQFSPDGSLIATATWHRDSVRIYTSQSGRLLVDLPIQVSSDVNQSLAWMSDSKQLFALSDDGNIHCLDVSTRTILSKWLIHSNGNPRCISMVGNGTLMAASAGSSVSFWNTTTREQVGSVIKFTHDIKAMAISANVDLVVGGDKKITLHSLSDILHAFHFDVVSAVVTSV